MIVISYILYFILMIGVLVLVHESGHLIAAKLFGVKVHTFSFGFGPKLVGFRRKETEYKICAVPLGGYVRMLGEDPAEPIGEEDRGRAFTDKPIVQRSLIILGGPLMNLAFPLALHFGAGLTMTEVLPSEVGFVLPGSPAEEAGLLPGDRIVSVDGEPVLTFEDLVARIAPRPGERLEVVVERDESTFAKTIAPEPASATVLLDVKETVGRLGVSPAYLAPVVGVADPDSPAGRAGLATFDRIVSVDGREVFRLVEVERALSAAAGRRVSLEVRSMRAEAAPPFGDPYEPGTRSLSIDVPTGAGSLGDLGIDSSARFVAYVDPEGAAARAGLARGDLLLSLDGVAYASGLIYDAIEDAPETERILAWSRGGQRLEARYKPRFVPAGEAADLGIARDAYDKGFWGFTETVPCDPIENPALVAGAARRALTQTWEGLRLIGIGLKLLFSGEVSLRTLGGPIMIGQLAGMAGQRGALSFVWMMALISLNLGLLNLLPIPILDGGQIAIIGAEAVMGRLIPRAVKERIMLAGLLMMAFLLIFVFWNDIARLTWTQ